MSSYVRDHERYYNTPFEMDGMRFASVADFEHYFRLKAMEEARCQTLTIGLKSLIKQMVLEDKVDKVFATLDGFMVK